MKWEHDKIKHASISFVLVWILWLLTGELIVAMSGTFLIGMGKELYDDLYALGSHWDNEDLLADAIGIVSASVLLLIGAFIWN